MFDRILKGLEENESEVQGFVMAQSSQLSDIQRHVEADSLVCCVSVSHVSCLFQMTLSSGVFM